VTREQEDLAQATELLARIVVAEARNVSVGILQGWASEHLSARGWDVAALIDRAKRDARAEQLDREIERLRAERAKL
jgi:hypothetical protein